MSDLKVSIKDIIEARSIILSSHEYMSDKRYKYLKRYRKRGDKMKRK